MRSPDQFARLGSRTSDPAEEVARVALAKREVLLRVHRFRLRPEDLEDCFSQAMLELVQVARSGRPFASRKHIANALEQRFVARTHDRRRALSGRSPIQAAMEGAVSLTQDEQPLELVDSRSNPERIVLARDELERIRVSARSLSEDQRLVLATQVGLGMASGEFCAVHSWSGEKYRKVAQRARARLRAGMSEPAVPAASEGRNSNQEPAYVRTLPHT